jgi:hypothetical protein
MKGALVIVLVAVSTTGCSELLYPGLARPRLVPHAGRAVAPPLPIGRWDNVMRLPRGATIDVLTVDGAATIGAIAETTVGSVTVHADGGEVRVAREAIVRVDLLDLPGSEAAAVARSAGRGALLGGATAAVIGAVIGGEAWPPPGVLMRAGLAAGAAAGLQAGMTRRQGRVLYIAPARLPPF